MEGVVMLRRFIVIGCLLLSLSMLLLPEQSSALEVVHEGTAKPGEFVAGFRAGPGFSYHPDLDTVGPALSFQGLFGLNRWLRVGMTLDWTQHGIDQTNRSLSTITLLPVYAEFRPGRIGGVEPYVASGIGVNINDENTNDTFAFRLAGGVDYQLNQLMSGAPRGLALNTEVTFTRNTTQGQDLGGVAWLFGVRWSFAK